jgi:type II secretory ATPase GspE/PulE/Tfp pilus assembly ATPase PilB-like protein
MRIRGLRSFIPLSIRNRTFIPASEDSSFANIQGEESIVAESGRSIIRLVDLLIERAHCARASDMHLDPRGDALYVRLRVDGVLSDAHVLPIAIHNEIISRIKILAGLRIDEHYGAQDGRFRASFLSDGAAQSASANRALDVRVSIVPTYYGENAVLRLLSETSDEFSLSSLGFTASNQAMITRALKRPYGMILATGPTGSGKTTSMYTLVKILNDPSISIVTLEDPIEYSMPGVRQIQINPKTGLTFAAGLRSILRQDPNVIMVGEIRDEETAGLAVNTALTGHRLLSTLHTNDAATTVARLLDMGVEPYLIASTVSVAIGSRLVRRICESCKVSYALGDSEMVSLSQSIPQSIPKELLESRPEFYRGAGCTACNDTGFFGRAGIHEVMEIGAALRAAILEKRPSSEIRSIAITEGMVPMMTDGFHKAARGLTTIEEILKSKYE